MSAAGTVWFDESKKIEHLTREKAYFLWENRVRHLIPGSEFDDWVEAEKWVLETYPWLYRKSFFSGIVNLVRYDSDVESFLCPLCNYFVGDDASAMSTDPFWCRCCGSTLRVVLPGGVRLA